MRAMKDSGVEWIGEIPQDWKVTKYKYFSKSRMGETILASDLINDGIPVYSATQDNKVFGFVNNASVILRRGDLIIPARGNSIGFMKMVDEDQATCTQTTICSYEIKNIMPKFLFYSSYGYKDYWYGYDGSAIPQVTVDQLKNNILVVPSIEEQCKIIDFLDSKCSKIDAVIAKQKAVIEKLKEYKLSVITEAVTKGLNSDVEMKDSGVEWIGEVPKHWNFKKLKYVCGFYNGDRSDNYPNAEDFVDVGIPFIGADALNGLYVDVSISKKISKEKYESMRGLKIEHGDILYTLRGSTIGKNAMAVFDEGTVASSLMAIRVNDKNKLFYKFLLYWLNSYSEYAQRDEFINGSTAPNLSAVNVGSFMLFLPTIQEQKIIVEYLDIKINKIEENITSKLKVISRLEEYKKSLIYEVVTGKKEV